MDLNSKLQLAYRKLAAARRFLFVGHLSPDADALSSIGAMISLVKPYAEEIYAFADGQADGAYDFIAHSRLVSGEAPADLRAFDLIVILDCGSISRTGLELRLHNLISQANQGTISERPYIIEIDHHEPQESYADLEIRDPAKASTTELIYHFLKANHLPITKELADCILIGLMTDTGNFLHSNSSREALEIASEMLLYGASLPRIIDRTVRNQNFPVLKVWGRILENMKFDEKTGFVSSAVTAAEANRLLSAEERLEAGDIFGGAASFLSSLAGVRVSLLLREEDGRVKGSLRTNSDDVDVAAIARKFGGGGHKKAAGFSLPGRLQETPTGWKIV